MKTTSPEKHAAHYDFDTPVERRGTSSMKWEKYRGQDIYPFWVADMDFRSPPAIVKALHERVDHEVYGYTVAPDELVQVVESMLESDFGWRVDPEWIVWLPGLVTGLNLACRAVGEDRDAVMTTTPVYPPFLSAPTHSRRELIQVPLVKDNGRYTFDVDRMERALTPRTRIFLLCNPHNPAGRVFDREELMRLAAFCERNDLVICSDEIHCGLILDNDRIHIPTATLSPESARRTITLMAPSKTYNIPGLGCSFAVIPDENLRERFLAAMAGIVPHVNLFGYTAALAAYRDCADWHAALLDYLRGNRDLVEQHVAAMPDLAMTHVEATYLAWIDIRAAGLADPQPFFEKAGVGIFDGRAFAGPGFVRLNFGCPRRFLSDAMERVKLALTGKALP